MRIFFFLAALLVAGSFAQRTRKRPQKTQNVVAEDENRRVVCYYTNWSVYRKGLAKYEPGNINPYLCTHLVYAFGGLTDEFEVAPFDSYQDIEQGGYAKFNGLKQYNKGMKTLLAIGGWNEGSARFSELVSLPEYRQNFTKSAIKHLRRYNFDGLDLDWEYPASREGSLPEDKQNYATLVQELREAFEDEGTKVSKGRLLLTMAVPAGQTYIDKGYDVPKLNTYLDFFNLLTYDYHSVYEPAANHHAPLYPPPGASEYEWNANLNIDWTIRYYLKKGASKNKLVVGIPTYGRSYTLLDGQFTEFGSSADGPGVKGKYTNEKGYLAFYEICELISVDGWQVDKPYPKKTGPIAFKGNQWTGYDDEKYVARKAEYVRDNKLGGIMFWTLDSDDFRGLCNGKAYPLIEAAKEALFTPSATSENEARALLTDGSSGSRINSLVTTTAASRRAPSRRRNPGSSRLRTPRPPSLINPYNTPEPPTTPAAVKGFQCKREGFQPDPEDCHKYYWCLNSGASGLGIVPHAFTCPSDLLFDKKIDGCNQPSNVKCKVQPNRGGSNVTPPTTTAIPRTTEFDESLLPSYDYLYEDYYLDDPALVEAIDETIATIPEKETTIVRNSGGGNQFQNARTNDINEEIPIVNEEISVVNEEIPSQNLGGGRSRPQYTSIQRDRPKVTESNTETEIVDELPIESPVHGNRPSRPQYTTLNRQRPAAHAVEEPEQVIDSSTDRGGLNYVTINRGRPAPTEPSLLESTTADDRLEYVTIKRSRPATTEASVDYISLLDYYDEELEAVTIPSTTSTTTEPTTTTEPPKIRIPTGRPTPPRRVPGNFNIRRRFRGRSTTTTTTTEESLVDETLNLFNTEITTPNSIARPQRPQRPTRPASTLVRPTGAPRRRIPSPIRRRPQRPSVQRREQLAREKQLAAEEAIKKEKVLEQELEAALAEELEAALAEELETAPTEAPLEETFIQSAEPKEVPLEDKPFIVEDVIEPKEVPFEDKPLIVEDVIEPKEVAQDVSEKEKVEAITPEEATPVDNVFDLFNQQQSEVQTDAPELVADKARPVILEEAVTSLPPVEEAIVEDKIETATIPVSHKLRPLVIRPSSTLPSPLLKNSSKHVEDMFPLVNATSGVMMASHIKTLPSPLQTKNTQTNFHSSSEHIITPKLSPQGLLGLNKDNLHLHPQLLSFDEPSSGLIVDEKLFSKLENIENTLEKINHFLENISPTLHKNRRVPNTLTSQVIKNSAVDPVVQVKLSNKTVLSKERNDSNLQLKDNVSIDDFKIKLDFKNYTISSNGTEYLVDSVTLPTDFLLSLKEETIENITHLKNETKLNEKITFLELDDPNNLLAQNFTKSRIDTTTEESLVDETLSLFNTEITTPNSIARPQRPARPASTLVRPTGAPRRRIPSPIRRRPQRPSVQRREQLAREKQLTAEEAIKKEKVLEQELEAALAEELVTAPTEAPLEETIQSAEPKEVLLEDKPLIVETVIEPKEVPFEDKPLIGEAENKSILETTTILNEDHMNNKISKENILLPNLATESNADINYTNHVTSEMIETNTDYIAPLVAVEADDDSLTSNTMEDDKMTNDDDLVPSVIDFRKSEKLNSSESLILKPKILGPDLIGVSDEGKMFIRRKFLKTRIVKSNVRIVVGDEKQKSNIVSSGQRTDESTVPLQNLTTEVNNQLIITPSLNSTLNATDKNSDIVLSPLAPPAFISNDTPINEAPSKTSSTSENELGSTGSISNASEQHQIPNNMKKENKILKGKISSLHQENAVPIENIETTTQVSFTSTKNVNHVTDSIKIKTENFNEQNFLTRKSKIKFRPINPYIFQDDSNFIRRSSHFEGPTAKPTFIGDSKHYTQEPPLDDHMVELPSSLITDIYEPANVMDSQNDIDNINFSTKMQNVKTDTISQSTLIPPLELNSEPLEENVEEQIPEKALGKFLDLGIAPSLHSKVEQFSDVYNLSALLHEHESNLIALEMHERIGKENTFLSQPVASIRNKNQFMLPIKPQLLHDLAIQNPKPSAVMESQLMEDGKYDNIYSYLDDIYDEFSLQDYPSPTDPDIPPPTTLQAVPSSTTTAQIAIATTIADPTTITSLIPSTTEMLLPSSSHNNSIQFIHQNLADDVKISESLQLSPLNPSSAIPQNTTEAIGPRTLLEEMQTPPTVTTKLIADVEKPTTTTSARPRTRRPIPFRPNLRPRPVSTPIETEIKEEKSEGRDISSVPSFTDILSGSRRNPPIGPRPVIVPESVLVATESPIVDDKPSTTIRSIPVVSSARPKLTTRLIPTSQPKRRPPQPRTTTTAQPIEYEYVYDYYDGQDGALGGSLGKLASLTEKAILLPDGSVECYDTGYFPHPESCKKFISCSKTVRGFLRGWTYTCPQELVFDPVGGMCNWTEAVDCRTNL